MSNNNKIISTVCMGMILSLNIGFVTAEQFEFKKIKPTLEIIEQAKNNPNTWVYIIDGDYHGTNKVPQHAIVGSWQVDDKGEIMKDSFLANPLYKKTNDSKNSI